MDSGMWVPRSLYHFTVNTCMICVCVWQGRQCCSGTVFSSGNKFYRRAKPKLYVTSPQPSMQGDRPPPTRVKVTPSSRQDALIHAKPASQKKWDCFVTYILAPIRLPRLPRLNVFTRGWGENTTPDGGSATLGSPILPLPQMHNPRRGEASGIATLSWKPLSLILETPYFSGKEMMGYGEGDVECGAC